MSDGLQAARDAVLRKAMISPLPYMAKREEIAALLDVLIAEAKIEALTTARFLLCHNTQGQPRCADAGLTGSAMCNSCSLLTDMIEAAAKARKGGT